MSYIKPTSDIYLFYGVPLDADYRNTLYWRKDANDTYVDKDSLYPEPDSTYLQTQNDVFTFFQNNYRCIAITNNTYQRSNKNSFRIGVTADDLYDVNYMAFRNTSFGDRWFFAFVTQVDYINNNTSEITYQIDVIQTWWFDWDFTDCFVAREHSENDSFAENLQPEPVNLSETIYNNYAKVDEDANGVDLNTTRIYVQLNPWWVDDENTSKTDLTVLSPYAVYLCWVEGISIDDIDNGNVTYSNEDAYLFAGGISYGVFAGLATFSVPFSQYGFILYFITYANYNNKLDNIISIYSAPCEIKNGSYNNTSNMLYVSGASYREPSYLEISPTKFVLNLTSDTLNGYTPVNKKLWTYPYNYLILDNGEGQSIPLRYEYFVSYAPKFYVSVNVNTPVSVMIQPKDYRIMRNVNETNIDAQNSEILTFTNYPLCAWSASYYQSWIATYGSRENYQLTTGIIGGITETAGSLARMGIAAESGNATQLLRGATGTLSGLGNTMDSIAQYSLNKYENSHHADYTKGSSNMGNIQFSNERIGFYLGRVSINAEQAEIIDNYFSMFGYATNKVKKPNYYSRPYYNYVQTSGCNITPRVNDAISYHNNSNADIPFMPASSRSPKGMNAADRTAIEAIFDRGITLWKPDKIHAGAVVGDYSVDNSV